VGVLRNRKFIAVFLVVIVIILGAIGYVIYSRIHTTQFEPFTSVFHILFEDASHDLLGNLTGKFEITQTNASTMVSTLTLALSSERESVWHQPYIDNVTLDISFGVLFYEGRVIGPPLPPIQRQILNNGESVVFHNTSHDVSNLWQPKICIFCGLRYVRTFNETTPSIQVHFSDGQIWRYTRNISPLWQDKYEYPPSMHACVYDLRRVAKIYLCEPEDPNWNPHADLVPDNIINILDLRVAAKNFGKTWPE